MTFFRQKSNRQHGERWRSLALVPVLLLATLPRTACLGEGCSFSQRERTALCGGLIAKCCDPGQSAADSGLRSVECRCSAELPAPMAFNKARLAAKAAPAQVVPTVGQLLPTGNSRPVEDRFGGTRPPLDAVIRFARLLI